MRPDYEPSKFQTGSSRRLADRVIKESSAWDSAGDGEYGKAEQREDRKCSSIAMCSRTGLWPKTSLEWERMRSMKAKDNQWWTRMHQSRTVLQRIQREGWCWRKVPLQIEQDCFESLEWKGNPRALQICHHGKENKGLTQYSRNQCSASLHHLNNQLVVQGTQQCCHQ